MMQSIAPHVFVVDDEQTVRDSLKWLFNSMSLKVETYDSAQAFLDADVTHTYGCAVIDVRMPHMSGLKLQSLLSEKNFSLPVIFLSAYGDAQMGAQAVKRGAIDFLQKPYRNQDLVDSVNSALSLSRERMQKKNETQRHTSSLEGLSQREKDVLEFVGSGKSSKEIARILEISPKTVDAHRARLMSKLGVKSASNLMHFAMLNTQHCRECKWLPLLAAKESPNRPV
jgi:two-component system response regulator TtrR